MSNTGPTRPGAGGPGGDLMVGPSWLLSPKTFAAQERLFGYDDEEVGSAQQATDTKEDDGGRRALKLLSENSESGNDGADWGNDSYFEPAPSRLHTVLSSAYHGNSAELSESPSDPFQPAPAHVHASPTGDALTHTAKAGWVTKQGRMMRNWKRRWLMLQGSTLSYFADNSLRTLKGSMSIRKAIIEAMSVAKTRPPGHMAGISLRTRSNRVFHFCCETRDDSDAWIQALVAASKDSGYLVDSLCASSGGTKPT